MLITYMNDSGIQTVSEVNSIHDVISDYNGGESISQQMEIFVTGTQCNTIELIAATNWANECTDHNMVGIACSSDEIFNESFDIVIFNGVGGVNEYLNVLKMEAIFDYYPVKNIRETVEYYNYKNNAHKILNNRD